MASIKQILTSQEIQLVTAKSDFRGAAAIVKTWAFIAAAFGLLAAFPHPLTFILVVLFLGGQQLACAILTHEAAHFTLFRTRSLNNHVADWLVARPVWTDVFRYRKHHLKHHTQTGSKDDPDLSLVKPFPCSRASLTSKFLRDITGRTGIRRIMGLIGMDIGMLKYTVAADVERVPANGRPTSRYLVEGIRNMYPVIVCNLAIVALLAVMEVAWVYSAWVVAYLTSFSLFIRIRSIAEHACLPIGEDIFQNTRTTRAGWLARMTVAPMNVNYHQEHHLMASVPFYRLPQLHRILRKRGCGTEAPGYMDVLRKASAA